MTDDIIVQTAETFTLIGVLLAFVIFARLAVKAKSAGSFRFQLSIFILIWVAAEIPHIAETIGLISVGSFDDLGLAVHMTSMAAFALFVGLKSYSFLTVKQFPPPLPPVKPNTRVTGAVEP